MNQKLVFFNIIVAVAAVSIGALTYTTEEVQVQKQLIQHSSSAMLDVPLNILSEHAEYVIVGRVLNITPVIYVDSDRASDKAKNTNSDIIVMDKEILSDVKIKVEEDLFGKYDGKFITVRVPGGEIPSQKTIHEQSPTFVKGERVIVFVGNGQSYDISADNYTVLGLEQGTVRLGDQVDSKFANDNTTEKEIKNKIKSSKR